VSLLGSIAVDLGLDRSCWRKNKAAAKTEEKQKPTFHQVSFAVREESIIRTYTSVSSHITRKSSQSGFLAGIVLQEHLQAKTGG